MKRRLRRCELAPGAFSIILSEEEILSGNLYVPLLIEIINLLRDASSATESRNYGVGVAERVSFEPKKRSSYSVDGHKIG